MKKIFYGALIFSMMIIGFNGQSFGQTEILYSDNHNSISVKKTKADIAADKAEVTLEVHNIYGHANINHGGQMLLDVDHNTYGSLFNATSMEYRGNDYDDFEYLIPENATADGMVTTTISDGEGTIVIPAGIYDFAFIISGFGEKVFPDQGYAKVDDFTFEGGQAYRFVLSVLPTSYTNVDMVVEYDLNALAVTLPENSMDLSDKETIGITFKNIGTAAVSNFNLCYQVEDLPVVSEPYSGTVNPGDTVVYTFNTRADLSAEKWHTVSAWIDFPADMARINDTVSGRVLHISVAELPVKYAFDVDYADFFTDEWIVLNADGNFSTWEFSEWSESPDGTPGCLSCAILNSYPAGDEPAVSNDWLISMPIHLEAGPHHLACDLKLMWSRNGQGVLDIFYGKSRDTASMQPIATFTTTETFWTEKIINFENEEAGTYYFALRSASIAETNFLLDNIRIGSGHEELKPLVRISSLVLPPSNCNLSNATPIGLKLTNNGTGRASDIKVRFNIDGGEMIEEDVPSVIDANQTITYFFTQTADFSELKRYKIVAEVTCNQNTETAESVIEHFPVITEFPFITNFHLGLENGMITEHWTQLTSGWAFDPMAGGFTSQLPGIENGLLSRCLKMEAKTYRAKMAYVNGRNDAASLMILLGKPGTDITTWDTVYLDPMFSTVQEVEFSFKIDEADEYNLLIVNTSSENTALYLYQLIVVPQFENDLEIQAASTSLSAYMPYNQISGNRVYETVVRNIGAKTAVNARLQIRQNDEVLFSSENPVTIDSGATLPLSAQGSLPGGSAGERMDIDLVVGMDAEDNNPLDNTYSLSVKLTDSVFAHENTNNFEVGIGEGGKAFYFGNIYHLTNQDTLTSISFGLSKSDNPFPPAMGIALYRVDEQHAKVEQEIFSTSMPRPTGGQLYTIPVSARILEPGHYYVEFQQLTANNLGATYVLDEKGVSYTRSGQTLQMVNYGFYLAIRLNFGHNGVARQQDVSVCAINKPLHDTALYTTSETVAAIVENNGASEAKDVVFRCTVGDQSASKTLSLKAYEKRTVDFGTFDLSQTGSHTIRVEAEYTGDEMPDDNVLERTVYCEAVQDPTFLDFEHGNDFDTLLFNPLWRSVSLNQRPTNGYYFDYPGNGQPVGFISFNINATYPPMTEERQVEGFFPYAGKRFGVAFAPGYYDKSDTSNTWLISPKIKLGADPAWELYVKTPSESGYRGALEPFRLWISTTDDRIESFMPLTDVMEAPTDWTLISQNLKDYAETEVHLALQYLGRFDPDNNVINVCLMVDNLKVIANVDNETALQNDPKSVWASVTPDRQIVITSNCAISQVDVFNLTGTKVLSQNAGNSRQIVLHTETYKTGLYLCRVRTEKGFQHLKVVLP